MVIIMDKKQVINKLKGGLIVSCQALPGEPLYSDNGGIMPRIAEAMERVGAAGIRCNSERDIREIREVVSLPVIGLVKKKYKNYSPYITPTMSEVDAVVRAGADIVAVDCTSRLHPGDVKVEDFIRQVKEKYDILILSDISTSEEAENAVRAGADMVSTTMSGYTPYTQGGSEPDLELVCKLARQLSCPVIAEGRIHTPEQVKQALHMGAYAVVVGGAITRPQEIAQRFMQEVFS